MTSIRRGDETHAWDYYLSCCVHQARIALYHLDRLWALEGSPADLTVWRKLREARDLTVWAELQGFVTAAIILNRFLDPKPQKHRKADERKAVLARQALLRGERLRELLEIKADSPLLGVADVRNSYEHIDERIDSLVTAGDIWSLSDWYISEELYFVSLSEDEAKSRGVTARHEGVRHFAPFPGLLVFGRESIDLFRMEAALHSLLATNVEATEKVVREYPSGRLAFGQATPALWPRKDWEARRRRIEEVREEARRDGLSSMVLKTELSTFYMRLVPDAVSDNGAQVG